MSRDTIVAKRYAKALFELAQSQNTISQIEQDLQLVVDSINRNPDFMKLLTHPNIDLEQKKTLLNNAFAGKVSNYVANIVMLLVERRREDLFGALLQYYIDIANEALGQAYAIVTAPAALTPSESQQIAERFSRISGKKIQISTQVDPSLLGGLQVRIGDRLYDGSLSGKLTHMGKSLEVS